MNAEELLPLLKETAERAELVVRRERGMPTGVAKIKGKVTLVLEPGTPPAEECHQKYWLSIEVPAWLRQPYMKKPGSPNKALVMN